MAGGPVTLDMGHLERTRIATPRDGTRFWFLNNLTVVRATAESTAGAYGLVESLIPPGASPPLHVHHREDEAFWVLEGELTIRCGERSYRAPAGSYAFLPRDVPHSFVVEGDVAVRMLTILSPAGGEAFFVEAGRPAEYDGIPPETALDIPMLKRVAQKFGMEIIGPPLAQSLRSRSAP